MYLETGRDYQLNGMPRDADGNILYRGSSPEDYEAYIQWLADYLYSATFEVQPRQQALCKELAQNPSAIRAAEALGAHAAWYDADLVDPEVAMGIVRGDREDLPETEIGKVLEELAAERQQLAEEARKYEVPDEDDDEEYADDEDEEDAGPVYTREDILQIMREDRERQHYFGDLGYQLEEEFLDLGWRVPLAQLLQGAPAKEDRITLLHAFFRTYQEEDE